MVVEFNPVITALLGCNTNVGILGSDTQAKSTLWYLLKYITKPPTELSHSLALIHNARQLVENYPSQASDSGTDQRTAMHFLTRCINQFYGAVEVSAPVAALALLGMPAEISSHGFKTVFVNAALAYAKKRQTQIENDNEFVDLPRYSSFISICYYITIITVIYFRKKKRKGKECVPEEKNEDYEEDPEEIIFEDCLNSRIQEQDASCYQVGDDDESLAATVFQSGKERKAVMQHIHYAYRGEHLRHYSLYEYAALIAISPQKKEEQPVSENEYSNESESTHLITPGRTKNGTFEFHKHHPLFLTHCQQLRSKTKIPVLLRQPPKPPPSKPDKLTEEWRFAARQFAQYILILFRPWEEDEGTLPGDLSWTSLCKFMEDLEFGDDRMGPTPLETVRRRWIENVSYGMLLSRYFPTVPNILILFSKILFFMKGLRVTTEEKIVNQIHRNRAATRWGKDNYSTNFGNENDYTNNGEQTSSVIEDEAKIIIDEMHAESTCGNLGSLINHKKDRYIRDTEETLRQVTRPLFVRSNAPQKNMPISTKMVTRRNFPGEPIPSVIYEKLISKMPSDGEHCDDDVFLLGPTHPDTSAPKIFLDDCYKGLNKEQTSVMNLCLGYLKEKKSSFSGRKAAPDPFRLLVHGGPGTGKSFLARRMVQAAESLNFKVVSMALTGIAAGLLPGGDTCHHTLALSCGDIDRYPKPLHPEKITELRRTLDRENLAIVIIDEISFIPAQMLSIIEKRLTEIMDAVDLDGEIPQFGGLAIILMGDFYQLPPVAQESLYTSLMKFCSKKEDKKVKTTEKYGRKRGSIESETRDDGALLFSTFQKVDLRQVIERENFNLFCSIFYIIHHLKFYLQQMRAAEDPAHTALIENFRFPQPGKPRVPRDLTSRFKVLSASDVERDPSWAFAPVIVTSNKERLSINAVQSAKWALVYKMPRITWTYEIASDFASSLHSATRDYIYNTVPQLTGYFVKGAPGYLTNNINPGDQNLG